MLKQILGAVFAGLLLFVWSSVSWMVLGLQDDNLESFRDEDSVVSILNSNADAPGMYVIPAPRITAGMTSAEEDAAREAAMDKAEQGPVAFVAYRPGPSAGMGRPLAIQFLLYVLISFLTLSILKRMNTGYLGRVWFTIVIFLVAGLMVDMPYWNWWHFSTGYTLVQMGDHVVGGVLAGLVLGRFSS